MTLLMTVGVIALVAQFVFAGVFSGYAEDKGHDPRTFFWVCFLFGIVGYCMVAALPDLVLHEKIDKLLSDKKYSSRKDGPKSPQVKRVKQKEPEMTVKLQEPMEEDLSAEEFCELIIRTPTEELKLILRDQRELYSEEEIRIIEEELSGRTDM